MSLQQNTFTLGYANSEVTSGTFINTKGSYITLWCVADGIISITDGVTPKNVTMIAGGAITLGYDIASVTISTGTYHIEK